MLNQRFQTFSSQPPVFIASVYPVFALMGKNIWAARLGIALVSMLGFVGAALLGNILVGRKGAVVAVLLLLADPFYLVQSQTLQSDAPSLALSLLSVALAYKWWESDEVKLNFICAILAGIALALGIFTKLIGICAFAPIIILIVMRYTAIRREPYRVRQLTTYSLLAGVIALMATCALIFIPLINSWPQLWRDTFAMYFSLQTVSDTLRDDNFAIMQSVLISATALAALYGVGMAVLQRDWRFLPILAWFAATLVVLWAKVPLYHHHLLAIIAPLIALSLFGIIPNDQEKSFRIFSINVANVTAWGVIAVAIFTNCQQLFHNFYWEQIHSLQMANQQKPIIEDVQRIVSSDQLIITDAQFLTALADRRTPASLVDTAFGRIEAGTLTSQELITEANRPEVAAILFYSGRLSMDQLKDFQDEVPQHFKLFKKYADGQTLWIKKGVDGRQ